MPPGIYTSVIGEYSLGEHKFFLWSTSIIILLREVALECDQKTGWDLSRGSGSKGFREGNHGNKCCWLGTCRECQLVEVCGQERTDLSLESWFGQGVRFVD